VSRYVDWRSARPGLWLTAAFAAEVATYASAAERSAAVMPWLLLDLWLVHRIWRGGATALAWFLALQTLGLVLFGTVLVMASWEGGPETAAGPGTVALLALSVWCLLAPALSRHVSAASRRRKCQRSDVAVSGS
jgi:hypothetical protein